MEIDVGNSRSAAAPAAESAWSGVWPALRDGFDRWSRARAGAAEQPLERAVPTRALRHLLLTEEWLPTIGGSINLFDEIYGRNLPPGDDVRVVAGTSPGAAAADARYPWPVTRVDLRRYEWMKPESAALYARMSVALARTAARDRCHVVHCARVLPEGLVAMAHARARGVPYVVWVHGEELSIYSRYPAKRMLLPKILAGARAVICNSRFSREHALRAGAPPDRVHLVHPCVDAARFQGPFETDALRERYDLAGRQVVLSVGRLTPRKNHAQMLRALAKLQRRDVVYLVASDGECALELHALARALGVHDQVRFTGAVPADQLPRYYAVADVFAMPNIALPNGDVEGFGMVFLEASASGRAVIGGRSGGVVDAVRNNVSGLLVDGTSVDEVAAAMHLLLDDQALRDRLGAQGRRWVREQFSWPAAAARVRALAAGYPMAAPESARVEREDVWLPEFGTSDIQLKRVDGAARARPDRDGVPIDFDPSRGAPAEPDGRAHQARLHLEGSPADLDARR